MNLKSNHIDLLTKLLNVARADILRMTTVAHSGHPGGSLSSLDIFLTTFMFSNVFKNYIKIRKGDFDVLDSKEPTNLYSPGCLFDLSSDDNLDAFYISHGHTAPAWYAMLGVLGIIDRKQCLATYRLIDSPFSGHVETTIPFISWDTGSLGQGLSAACAKALYYKNVGSDSKVWVFMGDGEQQKGQLSEARRFIRQYSLSNLNVIIDCNDLQVNGQVERIMKIDLKREYEAAGFKVLTINGHDFDEINKAITKAQEDTTVSYAILAKTISGKGVSFMENIAKYVAAPLTINECTDALKELNQTNDIMELCEKRNCYKLHCDVESPSVEKSSELLFQASIREEPSVFFDTNDLIDCKEVFGEELLSIANEVKSTPMFVFDCDLAIAVKTDKFRATYPSNFIQVGIQEQHAVTMAGALSKENVLVFYSDFAVFGLYEPYNSHNLNCLNKTNLKTVLTHIGLVGEDGKTHHCNSYIGIANTLYNTKLLLPADANQTMHMLRYMARTYGNMILGIGRSATPIIYDEERKPFYGSDYRFRYGKVDQIRRGEEAYLISCGPMLSEAYKAVLSLRDQGKEVGLINISTPLEMESDLLKMLKDKRVFVLEDHFSRCGLRVLLESFLHRHNVKCKIHEVGISTFCESGGYQDLLVKNHLDCHSIVNLVKDKLEVS